jgi:cell wall-associated NlpC family hydrolase
MPVRTHFSPHLLSTFLGGCRALLVLALAAALLLSAEQATPSAPGSDAGADVAADDLRPVAARTTKIRNALRVAKNQIGDPYKYGAAGPHRFDCSGLVYFSTHRAGFTGVPRTSSAQARHMRHIKRSAMRPGDFVFFRNSGGVYHAAIFVGRKDGRRRIVHAPGSGQRVKTSTIWTNSWFPATLRR